jgi:hypothetical protein
MHTYSTHPKLHHIVEDAHWLTPYHPGRLLLVKIPNRAHDAIMQLIIQWALCGPFYLIAAGEWFPDHDELRYAVYRYTAAFDEALGNLTLSRPFTCLQLLDLLVEAGKQNKPTLVLDFLHLFYDADVDLSLRESTLERCCQYTKHLSSSRLILLLVPDLSIEDYRRFFPFIASVADEIIEANRQPPAQASQGILF